MESQFVLLAVIGALGCGGYAAGSFSGSRGPFPGTQLTVGCLDVAVSSVLDEQAAGPAVEINFGNRCDARVRVDLVSIVATGRSPDGEELRMRVYDPRGEIRPGMLDVGGSGREVLEYHLAPRAGLKDIAIASLCLDLSQLDPDEQSAKPVTACVDVLH